jgi:SH3-like domain-containing protein
MSLGDRTRRGPDHGDAGRRRPHAQAQRIGGPEPEGRQLHRGQWIGLGVAAAAAVALTAGLVFAILTITRPGDPRPAGTPTAPALAASPSPLPKDVASIFDTPVPTPLPTPTSLPRLERLQVANTQGEGVNLRRDPGATGDLIKIIPDGTIVDVVGEPQDIGGTRWLNVRDAVGDVGWVAAGFLVPEGTVPPPVAGDGQATPSSAGAPSATRPAAAAQATPAAKPVATPGAGRGQVGNTSGQGANIRSEPGTGGRVLKTLAEGATIEVLGPEREVDGQVWRQVRDSAGVTGWIVRGAVVPAGSLPTPVPPGTRAPAAPATPGATGAPAPTQAAPAPTQQAPAPTARPGGATATPSGDLPVIIQPANTPTPRPAGQPTPKPGGSPTP